METQLSTLGFYSLQGVWLLTAFLHTSARAKTNTDMSLHPVEHQCSTLTHLSEEQRVAHVLCIDWGESVLVLGGDVHLIARQDVADGAELLDFPLKHLLQALVLQLWALHLLTQIWNTHDSWRLLSQDSVVMEPHPSRRCSNFLDASGNTGHPFCRANPHIPLS